MYFFQYRLGIIFLRFKLCYKSIFENVTWIATLNILYVQGNDEFLLQIVHSYVCFYHDIGSYLPIIHISLDIFL